MRGVWGTFFVALLSVSARADAGKPRLAVLEFSNKLENHEVDPSYFSEVVRGVALDEAPSTRVITRESLLTLLKASGKDAAECEGECEVDTGRRIGADYVVSGELWKIGSTFHLRMKLHDTRSADLLSVADANGKTVDELDASTAAAARKLFGPLRVVEPKSDAIAKTKEHAAGAMAELDRQAAPGPAQPGAAPPPSPQQSAVATQPAAPGPASATAPASQFRATAPPASTGAADAAGWRRAGYWIAGAGAVLGAGSILFAVLGKSQNDKIRSGGFADSPAIVSAASSGQRDNQLAVGLAIAGIAAVAVGIPIVLVHGEPASVALSAAPAGVALAGRF